MIFEKDHQYILTVTNLTDFKHQRIKLNFLEGRPELVYLNRKISDLKIIFDKYFVHDVSKVVPKSESEIFQTYLTILFLNQRYTRSTIEDCQSGKVTLDEILTVLKERFPEENEESWIKTIYGEKFLAEILNEHIQQVKLAKETKANESIVGYFDWQEQLLSSMTILRIVQQENLQKKNKLGSVEHRDLNSIIFEEPFYLNLRKKETFYIETLDQIGTKVINYMKSNMIKKNQVEEYFLDKGYEREAVENFFKRTKYLYL